MSSNRLIYDECAYKKTLQQSTDPLQYALYTGKFENSAKCRIELGSVGGNGVSLFNGNLVDLESDLRGQTRLLSDCSKDKYHPDCSNCRNCNDGLPCGCIDCQEELIDLQTKNMFHYNRVAMPDKIPSYKCPQPY